MVQCGCALCLLALAGLASVQCQFASNRYQEELLAQKRAITNWDAFKAGNNVIGWEDEWARSSSTDVCFWTGVSCSEVDSAVIALNLGCSYEGGPLCAVRAEGTLAPELANITTLAELSLHGQSFTGLLPASWGQAGSFPELKKLSLYENQLTGVLPPGWGNQTAWPVLQTLALNRNILSGVLPPAWSAGFLKLQQLYLDENEALGGALPLSWGAPGVLPELTTLSLAFAAFSGSLPASWGAGNAFPKLKELVLTLNLLSGTLPPDWGNATAFPALERLELAVNSLTGPLPDAWGTRGGFQMLKTLGLDSNNISGSLPNAWASNSTFPSLAGLNVDENPELCGDVPSKLYPAVCEAPAPAGSDCTGLILRACESTFPPTPALEVDKLLSLKAAITNWEQYSRAVKLTGWDAATPVCNWTGITCTENKAVLAVDLSCNYTQADYAGEVALAYEDGPMFIETGPPCPVRAQGTLPAELAGISTLQDLKLYNQNFSGTLPAAWGSITAFRNLTNMDLDNNNLSGPLPESWGAPDAFQVLQTLRLDRNNLNGTLPRQWGAINAGSSARLPALKSISLESNSLSGPLPEEWGAAGVFKLLQLIELGNNSLTGTLPASWGRNGSFPRLVELYLNNQKYLTGTLPPEWGDAGSFPKLYQMSLNNNKLIGPLPDKWSNGNVSFTELAAIELNNNQLTGSLPASWANNGSFAVMTSLELRNNRLSGDFPAAWNTSSAFPMLDTFALGGNPQLCGKVPALLSMAVCGDPEVPPDPDFPIPTKCSSKGEVVCTGPPTPPSVALPPGASPLLSPPSASSDSGSSVAVGAIVGGVVGGVAVLAVLAFFALRPRKGWLRRRTKDGKEPEWGPSHVLTASGSLPLDSKFNDDDFNTMSKLVPAADPKTLSLLTASTDGTVESSLPYSYITTAGQARGDHGAFASTTTSPSMPTTQSMSIHAMESDPVLSFISTRLATLQQRRSSLARTSSAARSNTSAGSMPEEMRQWTVSWDTIQPERLIGKGSYGRVYLGHWNATPVAIKVLINADGSEPQQDLELPDDITRQLQEEAVVMSRMRHPNVVSFMGLCTLPPCILTEYCSRGSLFDVLRQASRDPQSAAELTWSLRLSMTFDAARGLLYLHMRDPPIIHHDIKSPNLLIDRSWNVKVCDFNLSEIMRHQGPNEDASEDGATNPIWLAPEVLSGQRATQASDVYSFGLVMVEMLTWKLPWRNVHPYQIRRKVLDGQRPQIPPRDELPGPDTATFTGLDAYTQLMRNCWAPDPLSRPTFAVVVARLQQMMGAPSSVAGTETGSAPGTT